MLFSIIIISGMDIGIINDIIIIVIDAFLV